MCGFVGIHRYDGGSVDVGAMVSASETIAHRGPDGNGVWSNGTAALAHRRLAIIDPHGSPQPMTDPAGTLHIAFNGEILNYRELRRSQPTPFITDGDTEVLLAMHRAHGCDAIRSLRGQFAYATHDETTGETVLVRDRLGILPLFYAEGPGYVAFASEIKALVALIGDHSVDEDSLDLYLRRRSVPAPFTLYSGIRKLLPGHFARIHRNGHMEVQQYWRLDSPDALTISDDAARELVRTALERAVEDNLVADVPVGAYLSGGLDSSLICALTARQLDRGSLHTFSAGFGDVRTDETGFARAVSVALGTIHHEVLVTPDSFAELWPMLTWHRDAPLSEPADVAVHLLARTASAHVKVVLSGEGADEVFAGYPKHRMAKLSERSTPPSLRRVIDASQQHLPPGIRRARVAMRALAAAPDERYEAWFAPFTAAERAALLGDRAPGHGVPPPGVGRGPLARMLSSDCGPWLADNLLERGDRMTMAASVELRPPFLDPRVVELGQRLPDSMKVRRRRGKWILRAIAGDMLPAAIVERPKAGFRVPLDRWFNQGLRELAADSLLDPNSFVNGVFDRREVERLLSRHARGRSDESIRIWTLLSLEIWHRSAFRDPTGGHRSLVAT